MDEPATVTQARLKDHFPKSQHPRRAYPSRVSCAERHFQTRFTRQDEPRKARPRPIGNLQNQLATRHSTPNT